MATRERRIGIRELKSTLSECIREVKAGRTLVVTEDGDPVARMIPETASLHERLDALRRVGSLTWSGRRLRRIKPDEARKAQHRLAAEWPDFARLPVTEGLIARAEALAWDHALRGYHAVQLASALQW